MKKWITAVKTFMRDDRGASSLEYGLLVSGIALGLMAATSALGTALSQKLQKLKETVD